MEDKKKNIKITICGGGNLSHSFAGELGKIDSEFYINVLTRHPKNWSREIKVYYGSEYSHTSFIDNITDNFDVLKDSKVIIIALSADIRYDYLLKAKKFINKDAILISAPSTGGINFLFDKYFSQNKYVCLQRVPYISRTIEYGHSVRTDVKKQISLYYSKNCNDSDKELISSIIKVQLTELKSYYTLFLSNSNPILHIAGMLELLNGDYPYSQNIPLYDKWSDYASELSIKADEELTQVMKKLNVKEYKTLYEHYEVKSTKELTQKLKSIPSFKQVMSPMIEENGKYILDKNSRYLKEDLPFGTCFIKLFAQKLKIKTPALDFCIKKLQTIINSKLIDDEGILNLNELAQFVPYIKDVGELIQ